MGIDKLRKYLECSRRKIALPSWKRALRKAGCFNEILNSWHNLHYVGIRNVTREINGRNIKELHLLANVLVRKPTLWPYVILSLHKI